MYGVRDDIPFALLTNRHGNVLSHLWPNTMMQMNIHQIDRNLHVLLPNCRKTCITANKHMQPATFTWMISNVMWTLQQNQTLHEPHMIETCQPLLDYLVLAVLAHCFYYQNSTHPSISTWHVDLPVLSIKIDFLHFFKRHTYHLLVPTSHSDWRGPGSRPRPWQRHVAG